jgi:hypothetical protein
MREDRELLAELARLEGKAGRDTGGHDCRCGRGHPWQRGRGVPVVVVCGIRYARSEKGVQSILHQRNIGA